MTRQARRLRRQFNIYGMRFQRWLATMMPAFMPAGLIPLAPTAAPEITRLDTARRDEINRLIALWAELNKHEMEMA